MRTIAASSALVAAIAVFARSRVTPTSLLPLREFIWRSVLVRQQLVRRGVVRKLLGLRIPFQIRFVLNAMFAMSGPLVDKWPVSASQLVFDRLFTQSRKFRA